LDYSALVLPAKQPALQTAGGQAGPPPAEKPVYGYSYRGFESHPLRRILLFSFSEKNSEFFKK